MAKSVKSRASLIAAALTGGWRSAPAPLELSELELASIEPLLLQSGAAGIAWWRNRLSGHRDSEAASALKQAYRFQTIQGAIREREIVAVVSRLRSADIEPIFVKGWSVARYYPETGLRPVGDIDLIVRHEDLRSAEAALKGSDCDGYHIDLDHREFARLGRRELEAIYQRSQLVAIGEASARVLCAEDHLAFLCLHALRHNAWRPLWFCDIAAVVESITADFDWDLCLGRGPRAGWVASALGLAHVLLGARINHTPIAHRAARLPRWLALEVLKQWENPDPMAHAPFNYRAPMASYLRSPAGVVSDLAARWPNPIEATMSVRAPFNDLPRLPFQVGDCALRTVRFVKGLIRSGEQTSDHA